MHIIFDMYGVIIKESKGNFIPYVYRHFPETDKNYLVRNFNQASTGIITGDRFITSLGFADSAAVTKDYIENYLTFDSGLISFAEKYRSRFKYALLSNDVLSWSEYITSRYDIDKYFDSKIISGAVGFRKPDAEIYKVLLDKTGWHGGDCIFIDNAVKNLLTAKELGMKSILFNRDNEIYDGDTVYSFDQLDTLIERKYL